MILPANKVTKIISAKPRSYLLIENLTDSTVYISKNEYSDTNDYSANSVAIKADGILEINPCIYQGCFYAYSATQSDIRVLEL